ncbi:MAG TPA: hypothetical protein VFM54_20075 [Micromonosporaceae bacterium]|nr:hypothetical protein [Micromonosporaceae bacterium]
MTETGYDEGVLAALGRRRKKALADLAAIRPELTAQVAAAGRAGVAQVRVVELTGLSRDQVRLVWRGAGIRAPE